MRRQSACPWAPIALGALALAATAGASLAQPAADARCAGVERSVAAAAECGPRDAADFPVLFAVPVELADHQFNPETAPAWLAARRGRPLFDSLGAAQNFEVLVAARPARSPLSLEFSSEQFAAGDRDPLVRRAPVRRLVMRYRGDADSVEGWYLFAASDDEAIAWTMDRGTSNQRRLQYREGRVDMGAQLGLGRDVAGFQMAVFLGEYEISTRRGSSDEEILGVTLSRRR